MFLIGDAGRISATEGTLGRSYLVGDADIRPDERRVLVGGAPAALGSRAFDLLMCLIAHRDRVVGKGELLERVWPGLVVEEGNLTVHVSALRKLLGPEAVATVAGRGYRFAAALVERDTSTPPAPPAPSPPADDRPTALALPLPEQPSIAVLPFDNLGGNADDGRFIDGVIEDVITELSRFKALFVIARNSTFSYQGRPTDVRTIAHDLGVRYVVEGSIRRAAQRIRVTAQLVDATTGAQVWGEKYDRALDDIFAVQEELTQAIVAAIAPQVDSSETRRLHRLAAASAGAYALAIRARDLARGADREADPAGRDEAIALAQQAIAIDPACGSALRTIAFVHWQQAWAGTAADPAANLAAGLAAARRAIAIDGGDHLAHLWRGMLLMYDGQYAAGLADLRQAHALNPNDALTLSLLGQFVAGAGDPDAGIRHVSQALRLSPRDPLRWSFLNSLSWACFCAGDHARAAEAAQQAIGEAPRFYPPHLCLAISRVGLGEAEAAAASIDAVRQLAPQALAARLAGRWVCADADIVRRATRFLRIAAGVAPPPA